MECYKVKVYGQNGSVRTFLGDDLDKIVALAKELGFNPKKYTFSLMGISPSGIEFVEAIYDWRYEKWCPAGE